MAGGERPVVVVTGASRGIGATAAIELARRGADVVLAARDERGLSGVAAGVKATGGRALVVPTDVGDERACHDLIERAIAEFGRLDALVNNAGVLEPIATVAEVDAGQFRQAFDVNLAGVLYTTQAALPALRRSRGRIINVTTGAASSPIEGWGAYCASKAAALMLSRVLALEEPDVVVVSFSPGVVDTEMQRAIRDTGGAAMQAERHDYFVGLNREGKLQPPERPGLTLAWLALRAPAELSGETVRTDDERVLAAVEAWGVELGLS